MDRYRRGVRPAFNFGPFLSVLALKENNLDFNEVLREPEAMARAALTGFELGFESVVLPFDLNVEAEILGAKVMYHEGYEEAPVYPTVTGRNVAGPEDVVVPEDPSKAGRMPAILKALGKVKESMGDRGAAGVFLPGPFTLAGQVMDLDELFVMTVKNPEAVKGVLKGLTGLILKLRDVYAAAGAEFIVIEEGGATTISPRVFRKMLLPLLQELFLDRPVPQVLSMTGKADLYIKMLLECGPDAVSLDQESDLEACLAQAPDGPPFLATAGGYTMLAQASPEEIEAAVFEVLNKGAVSALPPADLYPPAKLENIRAFIKALQGGFR